MFYTVDTTTRLLLAGPTVQFPDGTILTENTKDDFTFPVQGWEWHPSDEAAYEAMAPEMLPVLAQQVADQLTLEWRIVDNGERARPSDLDDGD